MIPVVADYVLRHALWYTLITLAFTPVVMLATKRSRAWAYTVYSQEVVRRVAPQTKEESALVLALGVVFVIFQYAFPLCSVLSLPAKLGGRILPAVAILDVLALRTTVEVASAVILDWLLTYRIVPRVVPRLQVAEKEYTTFAQCVSKRFRSYLGTTLVSALAALLVSVF
jgi:hypothetical protein